MIIIESNTATISSQSLSIVNLVKLLIQASTQRVRGLEDVFNDLLVVLHVLYPVLVLLPALLSERVALGEPLGDRVGSRPRHLVDVGLDTVELGLVLVLDAVD